MALMNPFIAEMGGYTDVERPTRRMEKRGSLDLLGDAAAAMANHQEQPLRSNMDPSGYPNMCFVQQAPQPQQGPPRRSSLDFLVNGDSTLGRRNSLTHFLAQEFMGPSRRQSLANCGNGGKPIDPYHMENLFEDQQKFASGLGLSTPNPQSNILALQLLQQEQAEEENALSNVEEYIKLQKLQTSLRRQSLSNMYDEITIMQQMSQAQHTTMGPQYPDMDMSQLHGQADPQEQQLQHFQRQQMTSPPAVQPKPEPEEEELELPALSKENIDSFQKSMDSSVKSQQEIQVWDKKMGLKRSHSATMTKTTRSRKNLRRLLEKHMVALGKLPIGVKTVSSNTQIDAGSGDAEGDVDDDEPEN